MLFRSTLVGEIANASKEQTDGIEQVNTADSQMDKVTQSNAGNAEETAAAAEELSAQSVVLQDSVATLRALVDGANRSTGPAATHAAQPGKTAGHKTTIRPGNVLFICSLCNFEAQLAKCATRRWTPCATASHATRSKRAAGWPASHDQSAAWSALGSEAPGQSAADGPLPGLPGERAVQCRPQQF